LEPEAEAEAEAEAGAGAVATDRRGVAYVHLTAGAIALDGGRLADAMAELVPGLQLAQELGETQLGTLCLPNPSPHPDPNPVPHTNPSLNSP
jgi:hypothetical protein